MQIDNFDVWNIRIHRFKACRALVYKKLAGASTTIDLDMKDHKPGRLTVLLEGCEPCDIQWRWNGHLLQLSPGEHWLKISNPAMEGSVPERITVLLCVCVCVCVCTCICLNVCTYVNSDHSKRKSLITVGRSLELSYVSWTVHHCDSWRVKDQLHVTCCFISLLMCSTCFRH